MLMRRRGRDPKSPAPGIRRHGAGWQTVAKVRGERAYASWPLDTPLREMTEWQKDEKARLRTTLPAIKAGTFAADATRYLALPAVKTMPTYAERNHHISAWCAVFGARRRRSVKPYEIEAQRDRWLTEPREVADDGTVVRGPLSANAVNKRLRALSNVWTRLDGRRAPNPVLEVVECEEPDPEARGLPYEVIEAILAELPETAVGVKKDGTRTAGNGVARPSKTKARLRVIAYTGIAHKMLKALTRDQVTLFEPDADGHETGGTLLLPARRKGKKPKRAQDKPLPTMVPLIPQAAAALRAFDRLDCWGPFSNSSMWKAFTRACGRLGLEGLRPYDFRHSYLSAVYAETRDLRVTGHLGGHRSDRTTKRYTIAAVAPHLQAAAEKVATRLASVLAPTARNRDGKIGRNVDATSERHEEDDAANTR